MSRQRGRRGDTGNNTAAAQADDRSAIDGLMADFISRRVWSIVPFRRHSRHHTAQSGRTQSSSENFHTGHEPPSPHAPDVQETMALSPLAPRPSTSSSSSTTLVSFSERDSQPDQDRGFTPNLPNESQSGIDWRFAYEGSILLERSCREATSPHQHAGVTRRLYLDGIAYIMRGYPPDLDEDELLRLQQAAALQLDGYSASGIAGRHSAARWRNDTCADCSHDANSTLAYETSRRATHVIVSVVNLVLPYARLALAQALHYERRYNVSERVVSTGVNIASCGDGVSVCYSRLVKAYKTALGMAWTARILSGVALGLRRGSLNVLKVPCTG